MEKTIKKIAPKRRVKKAVLKGEILHRTIIDNFDRKNSNSSKAP